MASMRNRGSYDKPFNTGSKHFFSNRKCHNYNYHDQRDLRLFELSFNSKNILQVQPGMLFISLCEVVTEAILLQVHCRSFHTTIALHRKLEKSGPLFLQVCTTHIQDCVLIGIMFIFMCCTVKYTE